MKHLLRKSPLYFDDVQFIATFPICEPIQVTITLFFGNTLFSKAFIPDLDK